MGYKGQILENQLTGEDVFFLQTSADTGGAFLETRTIFNYATVEPPSHYHPFQEEMVTVMEGEITVRLKGRLLVFKKGDTFTIAKGEKHALFNAVQMETIIHTKMVPALRSEGVIESLTLLSNNGVTLENGKLGTFCRSRITAKYADEFRWGTPSWPLQKLTISLLSPLIKLWAKKL